MICSHKTTSPSFSSVYEFTVNKTTTTSSNEVTNANTKVTNIKTLNLYTSISTMKYHKSCLMIHQNPVGSGILEEISEREREGTKEF